MGTVPSPLTDRAVKNAQPRKSRYRLADHFGLYLLVMPKGGKHWRFDYRASGARRTLGIGSYPPFSLAEARDARDEARKRLRTGIDPMHLQNKNGSPMSLLLTACCTSNFPG